MSKASRWDVFVSAPAQDLGDYRAAAIEAVFGLGHHAVAMEHGGAIDRSAVEYCMAEVRRCDAFLCVMAWRYGFVPDGFEQSITELEFLEAVRAEIPRYVFLLDEDTPWPPRHIDRDRSRVERFREELKKMRVVEFFSSTETLAKAVTSALARAFSDKDTLDEPTGPVDQRAFLHEIMRHATDCRNALRRWVARPNEEDLEYLPAVLRRYDDFLTSRQLVVPSTDLFECIHLNKRLCEKLVLFIQILGREGCSPTDKDLQDCCKSLEEVEANHRALRERLRSELKILDNA